MNEFIKWKEANLLYVFIFFLTKNVQHTKDDVSLQDGKPNPLTRLSLLLIKSIGAWNQTSAGQVAEGSGQVVNVPLWV